MSAGDVIFTAQLDTKPFDRQVKKIENRKIKSPFAKFREDFKFFTAGMRATNEQFKATQKEALGYTKIYEELAKQAEELKAKIAEDRGGDTYKFALQKQWEELDKSVKQAKSDMEEAMDYMKHASRGKAFGGFLGNLGKKLLHIGDLFKGIGKHAKHSGNSISHGMGMGLKRILGLIGAGSLLYKTFQYIKEGMANLVKYDKATANAVNSLKGALSGLKNALAVAFSPILQAIEPILTKFIGLLTQAANAVGMFFSALTGKKVSVVASSVASGLDGIGSSASGANSSAKELQRTLMGFDKINKLDSDNGSGGGGGGGSGGGGGFTTVPITEDAIDWADKFRESWEKADFYWLGELLANKINDALEKIPWDTINDTLQRLAKSIGTFLNGFIENLDWSLLGQTISNGIKAGLDFTITFLQTLNGEAIGSAIVNLITGLDWVGICKRMLIDLPSALLQVLIDIFKGAFTTLGEKIADLIPDSLMDVFHNLGAGMSGEVNILPKIEIDDEISDVIESIKTKWENLKSKLTNITPQISLSDKISSAIDSIKKKWDNLNLKNKVATATLNLKDGFKGVYNSLARKINNARKNKIVKKLIPSALPYLAQGGYVKRNAPQLAMIGDNKREGEIVAPESKLQEMANKASSNPQMIMLLTQILEAIQSIDTNFYLDGESIKNNTVRRINNHTRATGQLELII